MVICKKCGRSNEDHYLFCLGCGARLADQQRAAEASQPPASPPSGSTPVPPGGWAASGAVGSSSGSTPPISASMPPSPASRPVSSGALAAAPTAPMMQPEPAPAPAPEPAPAPAPPPQAAPPAHDRACTSCGTPVPPDFAFCGRCGTRFVEPPPPPPPEPAPAPAPRPLARLIIIQPDGSEGERLDLFEGERILGRGDGTPLGSDPFLSPEHARVRVAASGVTVEDVGSLNGVFVRVVAPTELLDGAELRMGQELLRFRNLRPTPAALPESGDTLPLTSPAPDAWGHLERVIAPEVSSHAWLLSNPSVAIGRDVGDITFREDGFVSGRHARLFHQDGRAFVEDLGSSNGTYLRLRGARTLQAGELILIGQQVVRLAVLT